MILPIDELLTELDSLPPQSYDRARSNVSPFEETDTIICEIPENTAAFKWWVVADEYLRQYKLAEHTAIFDTIDKAGKAEMTARASRLAYISSLSRDIAWMLMKDQGGGVAWNNAVVGFRSNPEGKLFLVEPKESQKEPTTTTALATLAVPGAIARAFAKMLSGGISLPDDDEDLAPKPPKKKPS